MTEAQNHKNDSDIYSDVFRPEEFYFLYQLAKDNQCFKTRVPVGSVSLSAKIYELWSQAFVFKPQSDICFSLYWETIM